jgi:predicted cobalt transporter CbtA
VWVSGREQVAVLVVPVPDLAQVVVSALALVQAPAPESAVAPAAQKLDREQVVALAVQELAPGQASMPLVVDCSLCYSLDAFLN